MPLAISTGSIIKGMWIALLCLHSAQAAAEQLAGRVLFVSGSAKIVHASGHEKAMVRGDQVHVGDRLVIEDGALGQVKLGDGSLLALRSGSAVRLESFTSIPRDGIAAVVQLDRGAIRVINRAVLLGGTPAALLVKTSSASIRLADADGDAFVIETGRKHGEGAGAGTYSRVLTGAGSITTDRGNLWLERGAVGFAADGDSPPAPLAGLPSGLLDALASTGVGTP